LDAETLDLLEERVADYAGTLLLVSHDREFLDNVVTSTLVFEGAGRVGEYVGGYSDWLRQRSSAPAGARAAASVKPRADAARAKPRRLSYKEQRELEAIPERIQNLETEQALLQQQIADPELFKGDRARATATLERLQSVGAELEQAYARWDALESQQPV
jgi:ATP-binding cassette subfamily F protein uup